MWCQCLDIMNANIVKGVAAMSSADYCTSSSCTNVLPTPQHMQNEFHYNETQPLYFLLGLSFPALLLGLHFWNTKQKSRVS